MKVTTTEEMRGHGLVPHTPCEVTGHTRLGHPDLSVLPIKILENRKYKD